MADTENENPDEEVGNDGTEAPTENASESDDEVVTKGDQDSGDSTPLETDDDGNIKGTNAPWASLDVHNRRNFLIGGGVAATAAAAVAIPAVVNRDKETPVAPTKVAAPASPPSEAAAESANFYGDRPGGGITLPDYYRPWAGIKNNNMYIPGQEILPKHEMRVSFLGSTPWPPTHAQSGTSILVELGNDTPEPRRFFFDLGNGSVKNAIAMQVPAALINDIFISHLHSDHFADLPYYYPFRAFSGGYKPLRVYGPSGRTPELGIKHMIKHMKEMMRWHEENFSACPVGDGLEIDVHEFDWREENGICYDHEGVVVRHWPRSHVKDGASAFRLDWEDAGLSFVWTGDGRPDELTVRYGKGADVFVTEGMMDTPMLSAMKIGAPPALWAYVIDMYHTPYYAVGYMFNEVQPRIACVCHYEGGAGPQLMNEATAEIRKNWDGLFMFGGPDVQVINVTKDRIWSREAMIPHGPAPAAFDPRWLFPKGERLPDSYTFPNPPIERFEQQSQFVRDREIDPHLYYPEGLYREPAQKWPGLTVNPRAMLKARGVDLGDDE
ncbi:guanitoxin biosynthesis MBL fold metallo-hydrolase GntH [Hyphococcus sp. DH-69]|uniref:guanitoxin biosynthesis MBL fold metallo-hydrolase GntH n=1 Tax=Hyphococcus formosus TaxID=3143534 RepID=UPI00398AB104